MATIIEGHNKRFSFTFSPPETDWIKELAQSMGITKEAVVGAAMNKGLTHYVESFCTKEEPTKKSIDSDASDDI